MIRFERVTVTYPEATTPVLHDVDLHIGEGELCLVIGSTGSGKSTLLKCINGLVPHFTGGTLAGSVQVGGRDTRDHKPRELADLVGYVGQDPLAGFVTDTVEDELAYGMESLGVLAPTMRRRVEETLDLLGLVELRDRPLLSLSAGQQQRVAIGSVLTMHPRVLVLDEPTSALDPPAAEEVLAALTRLVHDLGMTVVLAEHRLERVVQYADRIITITGEGAVESTGTPRDVMATSALAPPVVRLARVAGWSPVPLSVRDARAAATDLRRQLDGLHIAATQPSTGDVVVRLDDVVARYGDIFALRGVDFAVRTGEVVAVMGRNGAGKSTLLSVMAGVQSADGGRVDVAGVAPADVAADQAVQHVALVPQEPLDVLWADSVEQECRDADRDRSRPAGATSALLGQLAPGIDPSLHPRDLSEGQRLALALAVMLVGRPPVVLLDEPTRGLDYAAKEQLAGIVKRLALSGSAVIFATHDVELAAEVAHRVVVLAEGEIVSDGPTESVVNASPAFAPQVAKVLAPEPWLTVSQVQEALERAG
jgi:energy-coupling factor transporter ATP-binding protein EcfA2